MKSIQQNIITRDDQFLNLLQSSSFIAQADVPVLITGESGTGKELMARAIHQSSQRAQQSFVEINCAALPESLVESELFGHCKGAFTSANSNYSGRLAAADNGTVFLDEIGELPLTIQAKLLRFLENGEIQPLGASKPRKINVRVIAATNRDLQQMVQQQLFRQDLFYRLNIVPIALPALRQRRGDAKLLMKHFFKLFSEKYQQPAPCLASCAEKTAQQYSWPGNVRELRNFCERMLLLFPGKEILHSNLPQELRQQANNTADTLSLDGLSLPELEQKLIQKALHQCNQNRTHAAKLLGISRDTLLYRLKKYQLV